MTAPTPSKIEGDVITVAFNPDVFPTEVLAHYLCDRIGDFLNDPEPASDNYCERIPKDYLSEMFRYLASTNKIYRASREGKDNDAS